MLSKPRQGAEQRLAWETIDAGVGERRDGFRVEEYTDDGSKYEGEFVNGLHHGKGRFTWENGQYYEGSFYKDYRHGDGSYYWPNGHKFTGKFYLNRREGYGRHEFPDGAIFQGLYSDRWFGPGVLRYPGGAEDVGLWVGDYLIQLCTSVKDSFSLKSFPEYASFLKPTSTTYIPPQIHSDQDLPSDESFIYPSYMERYSTNGDFLPLPPGRRKELDQQFFGDQWEPDVFQYKGYKRDPLSDLPLQPRMQAHIYKHRLLANNLDWDVAAIISFNRESFGPKGLLEGISEHFIQLASRGDRNAVSQEILKGLVYPAVADSSGHTALIAATVSCQNSVIRLLLDRGVGIDELNYEGMSALAVCHVLYYPFHCLHTTLIGTAAEPSELECPSSNGSSQQLSQVNVSTDRPESGDAIHTSKTHFSDQHRARLATMMLLLERGADPNKACVPMPVLFLAVMAADTEVVKKLLLCGARTDIPLPPERKGVYPLHVAAALPGIAGVQITEMLLQTILDPDALTCDQQDRESKATESGGKTALHVACQRETDYKNASDVVALLVAHRARTDLLWAGHSPLSLAIESGNELAVKVLLKGGADPNLPLGRLGNAICALSILNSHFSYSRLNMLDLLAEAGADILIPVMVEDVMGTAVDYSHHAFEQDVRLANTPFHSLDELERETVNLQRQLLSKMGQMVQHAVGQKVKEQLQTSSGLTDSDGKKRKPYYSFCYFCGRSPSVKLINCVRCRMVGYCSKTCQAKAWDENHKEECVGVSATDVLRMSQRIHPNQRPLVLKENYSYN